MPSKLRHLRNDFMEVTLYDDASARLVDLNTGIVWEMGPVAIQEEGKIDEGHVWLRTERSVCEEYPGRFKGELEGGLIKYTLFGRQRRPKGYFLCEAALEGPWLIFRLHEINSELPSLVFPPPIQSESLVIPMGAGRWIRKPLEGRHFYPQFSRLNMRWFGGLKGDNGWMAILDEGSMDAGVLATGLSVSPGWLKSLGQWTCPRSVRYTFTRGGYVGMAKAFRRWAMERGLFKSLKDKIRECPNAANLKGGRIFSFSQARMNRTVEMVEDRLLPVTSEIRKGSGKVTVNFSHADAMKLLDEVKELGMERGIFLIRGWINRGYDGSHPDIWPPEPALGPIEELKKLCGSGGAISVGFHDNYQDMYEHVPSFPKGVIVRADGSQMPGGIWAGGQAYIINSRNSLEYARRNWEKIKTLGPRAMFIDTVTATQTYESYEEGNTLSRTQDVQNKSELLRFFKQQGVVLGSEEAADFGVPYIDWFETRHRRTAGESVPLWPLVYHDAAYVCRYSFNNPAAAYGRETDAPWWLVDMLWGYNLILWLQNKDIWERFKPAFRETFNVDRWHGRIGTEEMLEHRFLTEDGEVEQTVFSSGDSIIVNFSAEDREAEGVLIPAYGYTIKD